MENNKVRVRFAPSPTGPLHIGGVRTALYNYLFAKKHGGTFILRIEDTDQGRFVPGAEQYILDSLQWCGITFDEGVHNGGPFAPYRQSERKAIYHEYIQDLVKKGHAYYAFDSPAELEEMRQRQEAEKSALSGYNSVERMRMKNSLTLTASELESKLANNDPYVIRMRIPENEELHIPDIIRGVVNVHTHTLDDKVLYKSDGMPTYHLANIVDDHLMQVSHVIRGEEWLPSLPLHILLYRAFGWNHPQFAHIPLILKPDGKGKLSKRDGDRLGFPVFPTDWKNTETAEIFPGYREWGYIPEAFINMLAFLGWNPGTEKEIFSMDELSQAFSLERVGKSGAKFDPEKAKWYNQQYLRAQSDELLSAEFRKTIETRGYRASDEQIGEIIQLVKERLTFAKDLWSESVFFFEDPDHYDEEMIRKRWNEQSESILGSLVNMFAGMDPFNAHELDLRIREFAVAGSINTGQIMNLLRLSLIGSAKGPGLSAVTQVLGKDTVIHRIEKMVQHMKK